MPKKRSADQARLELKHLLRSSAPLIQDIYPKVKSISISYSTALNETGGWDEKSEGTRTYDQSAQAWFQYDCKSNQCQGTFDLSAIIREMISSNTPQKAGLQVCQSIVRDHPCWVESNYEISIEYKE